MMNRKTSKTMNKRKNNNKNRPMMNNRMIIARISNSKVKTRNKDNDRNAIINDVLYLSKQ